MIRERFTNRLNSDRADSLSVSQILWIAFVVVLVLSVGVMIMKAIYNKSQQTADCINNSNNTFATNDADKSCGLKK